MPEQKQDQNENERTEITDLSETTEQLEQEEDDENIDTYERLRRKHEKFKRHFALDIICKHRIITSLVIILFLATISIVSGIKNIKFLVFTVPLAIVTIICLISFFRNPEHALKYGHFSGPYSFTLFGILVLQLILFIGIMLMKIG